MSHILLVDDDDSFRSALQKSLTHLGHQVVPARTGVDALTIFKHSEFDVVISDIHMPEMDGIALTREIKKLRPTPVILVTGFAEILETHEAHQLGAEEFLPKPFEQGDIASCIERCLKGKSTEPEELDMDYCKIGIEDFILGRQIKFNVFIRLAQHRFVKIANRGEDLPLDSVKLYKKKGVRYLYLKRDDFRSYIGFNIAATKAAGKNRIISDSKKLKLLKHTGEILLEQIAHDGVDVELYGGSVAFVETAIDILSDEPELSDLLEALNQHTNYIYAHSVGTCLYSILLAETVNWKLPVNKFKVAMGGLLHDAGQKDIDLAILMKPKASWTYEETKKYESHPLRSMEILNNMKYIPSDVIHIVKEHHEDGLAQGFPSRLRKSACHPMGKLVAVANEFCNRIITNPHYQKMSPQDAITQMVSFNAERLDPAFLGALMKLFNMTPLEDPTKKKARFS